MELDKFDYHLPRELIASYPKERGKSGLMILNRKKMSISHSIFEQLPEILDYPVMIVRNITHVVKTRIYARRSTGAGTEVLILNPHSKGECFEALIHKGGRLKKNEKLRVSRTSSIEVLGRENEIFNIRVHSESPVEEFFEEHGHVPLPPYIRRPDEYVDRDTYQTVYSKVPGSSAAPTAGLHFSQDIIEQLEDNGAEFIDILLHVGLGTFEPVKTESIEEHEMHSEYFSISEDACLKLTDARRENIPVLAIGTTSLRVLETVYDAAARVYEPRTGFTDIFIHPPMKIHSADMLLTNFHLPKSTLLMLVSSFAGRKFILNAYAEAVKKNYRFFSYGDSMLIR
ncbi:MAG: tRNA preQ1(34) S-adenosylmethionine ribosyltransferase-isomerase QueA [bacterium]